MIRLCEAADFEEIVSIINDGAEAYRGIIPADRWSQPYMPPEKLHREIASGVQFWGFVAEGALGFKAKGALIGVMGTQKVQDVTLIRHAYVRTSQRRLGAGGALLTHLRSMTFEPILIGTWADALWAIRFYEQHGFERVDFVEKERLLRKYWTIPERQVETSVVLADARWRERSSTTS